ncbi:MAG: phage tail protein [Planctomycetota bacterium]
MVTRLLPYALLTSVLCALDGPQGQDRKPLDPVSSHLFRVTFEGVPEIDAVQVRGLASESQPSGEDLEPIELVIVRPLRAPDALWQWRAEIIGGKVSWRAGQVDILRSDGTPVLSLVIRKAWPYKWVWPTLDSTQPGPAFEEIHFFATEVRPKSTSDAPEQKERSPLDEMDEQLKRLRDKDKKKGL